MKFHPIKYYIVIALISSICFPKQSTVSIGDEAPPISLFKLESNKYYKSKESINQKNLVVSFFATWCVPCEREIPELIKMSKEFDKDFKFLLVDVNEKRHLVKKYVEEKNISLQVVLDKYGKVFESFGGETLPLLVVIDKQGNITYLHTGYQDGDQNKLKKHLASL